MYCLCVSPLCRLIGASIYKILRKRFYCGVSKNKSIPAQDILELPKDIKPNSFSNSFQDSFPSLESKLVSLPRFKISIPELRTPVWLYLRLPGGSARQEKAKRLRACSNTQRGERGANLGTPDREIMKFRTRTIMNHKINYRERNDSLTACLFSLLLLAFVLSFLFFFPFPHPPPYVRKRCRSRSPALR